MFTGIIECPGRVEGLLRSRDRLVLEISAKFALQLKKGDSVCVNGACLTVTDAFRSSFKVDAVSETMKRTALNDLRVGDAVNLERAMPVGSRFDGHVVTGHVDARSIITNIVKNGSQREIEITVPDNFGRYVVSKGSVAVDGVSLTIASADNRSLTVVVIPHTELNTNLFHKKIGDAVNLEFDILAKYVEKMFANKQGSDLTVLKDFAIDEEFLKQAGFLN